MEIDNALSSADNVDYLLLLLAALTLDIRDTGTTSLQHTLDIRDTGTTSAYTTTTSTRQSSMYSVFCPGFQKGRVPSEKGTLAR